MASEPARKIRRLPREVRINAITTAAREEFAANGYDQSSMARIAAAADVAEGTIYKFFDSKRDLLTAILRDWYLQMIADGRKKLSGVTGTRARLQLVIWQHLNFIRTDPDLCRLFYAEVRSNADYRGSEIFSLNREVTELLVSVLEEGVACGDLRPDIDVRLLRDVIFGGIEHHVSGFLAGRFPLDIDRICSGLSDLILGGVARPVAAAPSSSQTDRFEAALERLEDAVDRMGRS